MGLFSTFLPVARFIIPIISTVIGIDSANKQARSVRQQASRDQQALERQRKQDLVLANQQISDIQREQQLANQQVGRDLVNLGKFSRQEIGSIQAQQGASGAKGLSAQLVVQQALDNKALDEFAIKHAQQIDQAARDLSIQRTRQASKFVQRESLITQGDVLSAGRDRARTARRRGVATLISGATRLSTLNTPTVSETPRNPSNPRRR